MKAELTGRQRARMADLSLLLDVILKTQAASAKQAICKNGILHQLQASTRSFLTLRSLMHRHCWGSGSAPGLLRCCCCHGSAAAATEQAVLMQVVHTRCVGPQYGVILKKMLRCVDHLPLTPNDIHTASSAHGSFGDVLHQLCKHTDLEVSRLQCGTEGAT